MRPGSAAALDRGVMLVSIDTEMAWGLVHRGSPNGYRWPEERDVLGRLLDLFDRHGVPATWAVVGHLFLDGCERRDGRAHPEIVRAGHPGRDEDWFVDDPCGSAHPESVWYAPDVVTAIADRPTGHEIACHGFSHVMAGEPGCSAEAFESELRAAAAAARPFGVGLRSFVYPRNSIGHQDVLAANGYVAYRGARPDPFADLGGVRQAVVRRLDRVVPGGRSVVRPIDEGGLWNFPATALYSVDRPHRAPRLWDRQLRRRLDHAASRRGLFHLWFHPHNLQRDPADALERLDRLCARAAALRDDGRLDMMTFGSLADHLDVRHQTDRSSLTTRFTN